MSCAQSNQPTTEISLSCLLCSKSSTLRWSRERAISHCVRDQTADAFSSSVNTHKRTHARDRTHTVTERGAYKTLVVLVYYIASLRDEVLVASAPVCHILDDGLGRGRPGSGGGRGRSQRDRSGSSCSRPRRSGIVGEKPFSYLDAN